MPLFVVWAEDSWLAEHAGSTVVEEGKEKGDDEPSEKSQFTVTASILKLLRIN